MLISTRRVMAAIGILYREIHRVSQTQGELMAQIKDVQDAVAKLAADTSKGIADATAKIEVLIANQTDPAQAAELQSVVDSLNSIDANVNTFDAGVAPAGTSTAPSV